MTQLASPTEVERVPAPDLAEFERSYLEPNKPVILTGIIDEWPAAKKWDADYLADVAGDSIVTVHFQEDGNFQRWYTPEGRIDKRMPLREFLEILQREPADRRYYMSEHDLGLVSRKLLDDVELERYTTNEPRIFLGRDTCMPLHYHATTEAVLCQITGSKEVLLYSPEQFSRLYANPWHSPAWMFSRVDGRQQVQSFTTDTTHLKLPQPEGDSYPKFKQAVPTVVRLNAGEALLIPVHWWHLTTCPNFQINVTFFWMSNRRRHTFPQPGLQVMAHEFLWKAKSKLRRSRRAPAPK